MDQQPTGLHPFSRRVALGVGGVVFLLAGAAFLWVRSRLPNVDDLVRRVSVEFAAPGGSPLVEGAELVAGRPVEVRGEHSLPQPIAWVVVAIQGDTVRWWVPPAPGDAPVRLPSSKLTTRLAPGLPAGAWRLVGLVGVGSGTAEAWLARHRAGDAGIVARELGVTVREVAAPE